MDRQDIFPRLMTLFLVLFYTGAWAYASIDADRAVLYLALGSGLVTFPFFLFGFVKRMIGGKIIMLLLIILSALFPFLIFIVAIWAVISIMAKFSALVRNLPYLLVGVVLYLIAWTVPAFLCHTLMDRHIDRTPATILVAAAGASLFLVFQRKAALYERRQGLATALALGGASYLLLFCAFLLLPSDGTDIDHDT